MPAALLPDPLHPAIVHLPIALAVLLPLGACAALYAIHRGAAVRRAWGAVAVGSVLLLGSALLAKETGEDGEERVERIVPREALHAHEEAADRFTLVVGTVTMLALLGLRGDRFGRGARAVATVGTLAVLATGWAVGHAGGELVYRHGAARAWTEAPGTAPAAAPTGAPGRAGDERPRDDDDDRPRDGR